MQLQELSLTVNSGSQRIHTQIAKHRSKHLYTLSHLTEPRPFDSQKDPGKKMKSKLQTEIMFLEPISDEDLYLDYTRQSNEKGAKDLQKCFIKQEI